MHIWKSDMSGGIQYSVVLLWKTVALSHKNYSSEDRKYEQGIHKHDFLCLNHIHWGEKTLLLHFTMTEKTAKQYSFVKISIGTKNG